MISFDCYSYDMTTKSITETNTEEWSILSDMNIRLRHMVDAFGFTLNSKGLRFDLVPAKFDEKECTLYLVVIRNNDKEDLEYQLLEFYLESQYEDDPDKQKELISSIKNDLAKAPKASLHTIYMLALMDVYFGWNSTANYDKFIHLLSKLKLPNNFRKKQFPLYRALSISKQAYNLLKKGEPFKLRKRVGTSWGKSKSRPIFVARKFNQNGNIIVIELKPNSKLHVILNGYETQKDATIKRIFKISSLPRNMLDEVILKGNGGLVNVTPNMVTNSSGKKMTSFVKASFIQNNIEYVYI